MTSTGRRYAGLSTEQRTQARRAAVLEAALDLFGTAGYPATSVKQVCRAAGLTERYFYESFTDREDCLAKLYDQLAGEMYAATLASIAAAGPDVDEIARAGLDGFVRYLTDDPRRARVVLVEVVGVSPGMEERRHAVLRDYSEVVTATWGAAEARPMDTADRLTTVALVGGVNHLLVNWLMTGSQESPGELVDVCARLFSAARGALD
ncbi:TetR/AcrR family transcriptional regulator [Speluncibacter jeojiensis]|uniref:TetR/AcrR family transcriptional regulator n=1 Tax=Speluncibacter jeojiensis TaxID=2710754 RepID=UPI00240F8AB8|nr:helix-turn-helix domain-containing protein [Rhodococcus sp. D2-41]